MTSKGFSITFRAATIAAGAAFTGCDHGTSRVGDGAAAALPESGASGDHQGGPLVVSIVVDQFAAWAASERLPSLPRDGGFARLLREGTYARELRYAHAATETAPGHAALYTGSVPRTSGIWANETLDPTTGVRDSILADSSTRLLFADVRAFDGASARALDVDTVADRFRAAQPDAVVVSLSLKDRGAIFAGGRRPTATLWFDRSLDRFVTSTAFANVFPRWAEPLAVPRRIGVQPWNPLDPAWVAAHAATPDAQEGEAAVAGMPITFPHDIARADSPSRAFVASPFGDDALFNLAIAALDAHRERPGTRFLALSLSSNDYIGHAFGPDSWEAWDELRRLDAQLSGFFRALDHRFGERGWSVLLTGDHGVTTVPEVAAAVTAARPWCERAAAEAGVDRWQRPCGATGRLHASSLTAELAAAAESALHRGGLVAGIDEPYVILTRAARSLAAGDRRRLIKALTDALRKKPEIEQVYATDALEKTCPPDADESVGALVCRSFVPGRAGDIYIVTKAGSFFDPEVQPGKGTSHGSPWLFDRSVPFFVRTQAPPRTVEEPVSFRSFARTLATLLGVEPSDAKAAVATDFGRTRSNE